MKELVETIQEAIKERLRCPFTSAFMLSFLAFNWRILLSIFFVATPKGTSITDSVTARIGLVEGMEIQYLWPLGFSIAYVAVTPWIHWGVEFGQSFARKKHKKLRINEDKEIDIERIEAETETEKLRIEARRLRAERLEIDQQSTETVISGLEDRMSKLQEAQSQLESLDSEIDLDRWSEQIQALREKTRPANSEAREALGQPSKDFPDSAQKLYRGILSTSLSRLADEFHFERSSNILKCLPGYELPGEDAPVDDLATSIRKAANDSTFQIWLDAMRKGPNFGRLTAQDLDRLSARLM